MKEQLEIQKGIRDKSVSMAHARALINVQDPMVQLHIFKEVIKRDLSVRATEQMVREYSPKAGSHKKKNNNVGHLPAHFKKMQDQLASQLSTRVIVKQTGPEKGEITILFFSNDDLDRISDLILQ